MTRYRTIVADPPWDHSDGTGWSPASTHPLKHKRGVGDAHGTRPVYASLSLDAISALPVSDLAEVAAHLYLWTTNRYLEASYGVARSWGFEPVKPIVWCKLPKAPFIGGVFGGSSVEFCLYAKRGNVRALARAGRQWFDWPRTDHSVKPDAFLDLVEQVSPGPYVELFARRARFGWDYWGNESLGTAEMVA